MKKIVFFVVLCAGWYKYVSSGSTSFWAFALLLLGSVILILATIRAFKKVLAAQNVVAAAATFQTLSAEQKTRVHDHAIDIVLRGGWRGRGAEGPSFRDDAAKFGWYALAMHEQGIEPITLVKNWNYVKNPFTDVFIEDACIATCIKGAQRQGHQVKLLPRASISPATDPLSKSSDLVQLDGDDHSSTPPAHMQVQAEAICRANQIWFLANLERHYPLSEKHIALLKDRWDWEQLSRNDSLPWSERLIVCFQDNWAWTWLSNSEQLPWSERFILQHKDRWDWAELCLNPALPWSEDFIDHLKDLFEWDWLSGSKTLPWTEALIARYDGRWDWRKLSTNESLPWSEALISRYEDRWDWSDLSAIESLPWSDAFISRYEDRWDWEWLSRNEALPWSDALISRYEDRLDWGRSDDEECYGGLARNRSAPWTDAFISRYEDRWDWEWLSRNEAIPWSEALISRYEDRWNWNELSANRALPWTEAFVARFEDRWDWHRLISNKSLPWTEVFIVRYEDRLKATWDWVCLSWQALPWSETLIARYVDRWDWKNLSSNKALPWSEALVSRFEDHWDWGVLRENDALQWQPPLLNKFERKFNVWRNRPIQEDDDGPVPDVFSTTPIYVVEGYSQPLCFNLTARQVDSILEECFHKPAQSTRDWAGEARVRRAAEVDKAWLKEKVSRETTEAKHMVLTERLGPTPVLFGFQNYEWAQLVSEMKGGDELWEYSNDSHYWENLAGRSGIVVVRNGEIIDCITTRMS